MFHLTRPAGWTALILLSIHTARGGIADSPWSVHGWQSDDGLPNNNVTSLAQTPDGYTWVATATRLTRFDGVQFEGFNAATIVPGYQQRITTLLPARDGALWIGMDHGPVVRLNSGSAMLFTNNLPDLAIQTLTEDGDGNLWMTYRGEPVRRIVAGEVQSVATPKGLPGGTVCSLARDVKGKLWFAKGGKVGVLRDGRFTVRLQLAGYTSTIRLAARRAGGIWICSSAQLSSYDDDGQLQECGAFQPTTLSTEPNVMLEDHSGAVWIGTSSSGLFRFSDGRFENVPTSHREILSLLEDREGNLWAGTGGGGLNRIRPRAVNLETAETGLPFETVQSLCEDSAGLLWATTQNGLLACRKDTGWNTISSSPNWPGGRATCVTTDRSGAMWIGTKDYALHCLKDGVFTTWRPTNGLASHNLHALLAASSGDLWIGANAPDTLQRLHDGKLSRIETPADMRTIRTMTEDPSGNIWIGTVNGLLLRVRGETLTDETDRICSDRSTLISGTPLSIRALQTTANGTVWIGYAGGGVGRLDAKRFARITSAQGLLDDFISQIVADADGWLWFGADRGIFKVRQQELDDVAEGRCAKVRCIRYGQSEALLSLQANFGNSPGALKTHDGRLWIPMRSALVVVDPRKLREDPEPPPVLLKRVAIDDNTAAFYGGVLPVCDVAVLAPKTALRVPPGHHRLAFEFTALSFSASENVQFRYQLEGFDEHWTDAKSDRNATYSRLTAGDYTFRVKACNGNGVWNETGAALAFIVEPFVWQTWWFRLLAMLLFTAGVVAVVRYVSFRRLRLQLRALERQAELDKERARIARDIHDDVGGSLTQIKMLFELVQRDLVRPANAGSHVQQGLTTAQRAVKSLDEIVWAVNPRNDTLPHLIDYLGQFAVEFFRTAGTQCRVDLPDHPPDRTVPADVRHNLFLVVKETFTNISRHAGASEVRVGVAVDEASLRFVIEDNGRGFSREPNDAFADGLRNMRQRMEEIGGAVQIESATGAGTRVSFVYSWPDRHN